MTKVNFNKLKLKMDKSVKKATIMDSEGNEVEIEILRYLPLKEKIEIISSSVNTAIVSGIIREELLSAILGVQLVQKYTNLSFTEKTLENSVTLYDILESNGVISVVEENMEELELEEINSYIKSYSEQMIGAMKSSISGYKAQTDIYKEILGDSIKTSTEESAYKG